MPKYDNRISGIELHGYNPYANSSFDYNDEIRIPIQQQDLIILPHQSYLYIEGKVIEGDKGQDSTEADTVCVDNNGIAFIFSEIRYELNGVEVDRCKNVGITTTLKNYASLTADKSKALQNASWNMNIENNNNEFNYCIPMRMLMGFFEDYKRVIMNARHELVLIRARDDKNALFTKSKKITTPKIELIRVQWKVPHIMLDDYTKLQYLRVLQEDRSITMAFRSWDLYEYPLLPSTQRHTWSVKTSAQLEKPRFVIVALQTNRKNDIYKHITKFDHCKLRDLKLFLNSDFYPYDALNLDFNDDMKKLRYGLLYDMYSKFIGAYYNNLDLTPMLDLDNFFNYGPLTIIDCSHQNESVKSGTVDVKLEFECLENIPPNTSAYCLIIHDRIVEYNSLSNIVRKVI